MRQHANGVLFEGTPVDFFFETLCSVFMKNMIDVFGMSRQKIICCLFLSYSG